MHAALRRVAHRALANAPARAPSTIARRSYASDPNAPPKVPYPWHDPMNPSNWKEEHVVFAVLGGWAVVIAGARSALS
ncbi:predicted protein [Ostreococcus lucimarinus CCE9901]|uniref:Uncharacterized protein n=1 Tax=Ostreococcus lucimarinus (strain CCE9901) TaxID=436017 RepID=A4RY04_OSTLU|nr:predicted protein [Ostreococcus lucimarinus CCE9901]ABO96379.1 predicted protein [Ostreococcus lucimarinus CCE9901]|eukprot:XP_001418086.1 predicted protein [Ostreococcus lucimarinus CCE9901]